VDLLVCQLGGLSSLFVFSLAPLDYDTLHFTLMTSGGLTPRGYRPPLGGSTAAPMGAPPVSRGTPAPGRDRAPARGVDVKPHSRGRPPGWAGPPEVPGTPFGALLPSGRGLPNPLGSLVSRTWSPGPRLAGSRTPPGLPGALRPLPRGVDVKPPLPGGPGGPGKPENPRKGG